MSYEIREFKIEDFDSIELRPQELAYFADDTRVSANVALVSASHGWTLLSDSKVLAIGGVFKMWPGVYEVWLFPDISLSEYTMAFAREARKMADIMFSGEDVHRLQTSAKDDELHTRFMQFLGFTGEGILHKYSPSGENHVMWSRTK